MSTKMQYYYPLPMLVLAVFATFSVSLGRTEPEFSSLITSKIDRSFALTTRLSQASAPSASSLQVFNVDAFGAKADGTDDSQVFYNQNHFFFHLKIIFVLNLATWCS